MSYSISSAAEQLYDAMQWQKTPTTYTIDQYQELIIHGIKNLLIDQNRYSSYDTNNITTDNTTGDTIYSVDLNLAQQQYVLLCAKILFMQKVATDVNNIVGYTTDALSITNADKPYANIKQTLDDLNKEKRKIYYKMTQYAFL